MGGSRLEWTDFFKKFVVQDWIGFNFADQDWTWTEKFYSPLTSGGFLLSNPILFLKNDIRILFWLKSFYPFPKTI